LNHRYFIKLSFDGTAYHGWQSQINAHTLQQELEQAMTLITGTTVRLTGAGRTDTGVHAKEFYVHFDLQKMSMEECDDLVHHLNRYLPPDIAIDRIIPVNPEAHARFDAVSRTYQYMITRKKDPFRRHYAWYYFKDLDVALMNEGCRALQTYDDFTSFSKLNSKVRNHECHLMGASWEEQASLLVFTITADRFLRNMVRAIVGTMIELGRHKTDIEGFRRIIEGKDRSLAGMSVPACGLYLVHIEYPESVFIAERE
jgi:tRNA pseudouridine38-40 synthase